MKRLVKTFALLMAALLLLVTGVDRALDRAATAPSQASFTFYNARCRPVYVYNGNLAGCRLLNRPITPRLLLTPRA
jgi:hypothetical protein